MKRSKNPRINLILNKVLFNILLESLNKNEKTDDLSVGTKAKKLKDKLLLYSIPKETDEGEEYVRLAFFNVEASKLIEQLLIYIFVNEDMEFPIDYYSVIKRVNKLGNEEE